MQHTSHDVALHQATTNQVKQNRSSSVYLASALTGHATYACIILRLMTSIQSGQICANAPLTHTHEMRDCICPDPRCPNPRVYDKTFDKRVALRMQPLVSTTVPFSCTVSMCIACRPVAVYYTRVNIVIQLETAGGSKGEWATISSNVETSPQ